MDLFVTDVSTVPNARRAARDGAIACFLLSVFAAIGGWFSVLQGQWPIAGACMAEAALGLVAGGLLLRGRGALPASLAAAIMAVETAVKLLVADAAVAAFAEAAMLAYTINAVRAVRVLRLARHERMVNPEI